MSDTAAVQASLEARLRAIMQSWQPPIAADCEQHLSQLIHEAALRVEAEGFASDPEKLWEAETNFRKLLTEMTRQAGVLGFNELHEPTFFNSLAGLCPIWPFC
jgi:hypothetical protein